MSSPAAPTHPSALDRRTARALLGWFDRHRRPLPWRSDRDPYRLWLAEVLLQQTRVAQAIPYFERMARRFPTVDSLARASESDVLRVWAGAGYYARARNLHRAARQLVREHGGRMPRDVEGLERLPGVGPYIARAIAAFAYDAPVVALEANGLRVAARWTLETGDLRSTRVRTRLGRALEGALPPRRPGAFNEAVMELGETICLPADPRCGACPVSFTCRAQLELDDPGSIPWRPKRSRRPHVRAAVVVLDRGGRWLVQRRPSKGLLGGLWEFPGGKVERGETPRETAARELKEETGLDAPALESRGIVRHSYSHFSVSLYVFVGSVGGASRLSSAPRGRWVTPGEFGRLPLPKATEKVAARVREGGVHPDSGSRRGRTGS